MGLQYLGVSEAKHIRSFNEDARWFIMNSKEKGKYDFVFGDAFNDLSIPYHLTTKEFALQLKSLMKPDGLLMANVIDSFKKGLFMPAYIRTLEEVFGKGNVHLLTLGADYDAMGISTLRRAGKPPEVGPGQLRHDHSRKRKGGNELQRHAFGPIAAVPEGTPHGGPDRRLRARGQLDCPHL